MVFRGFFSIMPLAALGATPEAIALVGLANVVVGLFQHANIDFELGPLSWIGTTVCVLSVILCEVADRQLKAFKDAAHPPGSLLDTGVWAWVRNPNYLGEVGFWWGLWLLAVGSGWTYFWTIVGPAWITALFLFISIPLKETRMAERRGELWEAYVERTPMLLPIRR